MFDSAARPPVSTASLNFLRQSSAPPPPPPPSSFDDFVRFASQPATVASTTFSSTVALAQSKLQSLRDYLPRPLQSLLPQAATAHQAGSSSYLDKILPHYIIEYLDRLPFPPSAPIILALLAVITVVLSMDWRSYVGRYSPFSNPTPRESLVTSDSYSYMTPEHIDEEQYSHYNSTVPRRNLGPHPSNAGLDDDGPDILLLKHLNSTHPIHLPPYAIAEGRINVGELRRLAAERTGTADPRRIRLIYKGKALKDDRLPCHNEGLKQRSEVMVVVSEVPINGDLTDSSDSLDEKLDDRDRPQKKRKNHRGGKKTRRQESNAIREDQYLAPDNYNNANGGVGISSRSNTSTPQPPSAAAMQNLPPAAKIAMDKLEAISNSFHTQYMHLCTQFLNDPPRDMKTRKAEYVKLSESILQHVLMKYDGVEPDGNQEVRNRRKALVKETQDVLTRLDTIGKHISG